MDPSSASDLFNHYLNLALQQQQQQSSGDLSSSTDPALLLAASSGGGINPSSFPSKFAMLGQSQVSGTTPGSEDYCELCQKQFCNKYYLKKHKLDVHGISADISATPNTPPPTMLAKTNLVAGKLGSAASPQLNGGPQRLSSSQTISSILAVSALNNKNSPIVTGQVMSSLASREDESSSSCKQEPDEEVVKVATVNLPGNGAPILNKLPLGGTEVKCDKCTKVFYNLEYLTLHKLNKHGISGLTPTPTGTSPRLLAMPPMNKENSSSSVGGGGGGMRSRSSTTIIKNEQPSNTGSSSPASNLLQTEAFCEYCNKSFCNKYFLRTHMSKAHGKTLIIENNSNNTMINSILNGETGNGADSTTPTTQQTTYPTEEDYNLNLNETYVASKVVDRVICDICNKQVCNKYFLRTHKQKVHGIYETSSQTGGGHQSSATMSGNGGGGYGMKPDTEMEADDDEYGYQNGDEMGYDDEETAGAGPGGYDGEIVDEKELGECERAAANGVAAAAAARGIQSSMRRCSESSQNSNGSSLPGGSSSSTTQATHTDCDMPQMPPGTMDLANSYCHLCKRKFYSYNFLRNHAYKIHGMSLPKRSRNENGNTPTHPSTDDGANMDLLEQGGEFDDDGANVQKSSKRRKNVKDHLDSIYAANQIDPTSANSSSTAAITNLLSIINMNLMKQLDCQLCSQPFTSPILLKQHVTSIHKIDYEDYLSKFHVNVLAKNGKIKTSKRKRKNSANSTISSMSNKTSSTASSTDVSKQPEMAAFKKMKLLAAQQNNDDEDNETAFDENEDDEHLQVSQLLTTYFST